jgi:DNA-binding transcriptional ArsR family regulator
VDAAFAALGEPRRREILTILAGCELAAGAVVDAMQATEPISQPAVSQHLKVLREAGLISMRAAGTRRLYTVDQQGLDAVVKWLSTVSDPVGAFAQPLDALTTEVARGKRRRPPKRESGTSRSA